MINRNALLIALSIVALSGSTNASEPVVLHWQIKPNPDVFGFNIYRASNRAGPYVRVNKNLLGAGMAFNNGSTNEVRFEDTAVASGGTYYYYVDVVKRTGLSERLTGVLTKTVE